MDDKILVELVVPILEEKYDIFIPANIRIGHVIELCSKAVCDLSGGYFTLSDTTILYNGENGTMYSIDLLVRNTDIRNGTRLILM